jgi:hypothetical protein
MSIVSLVLAELRKDEEINYFILLFLTFGLMYGLNLGARNSDR